MQRNQIKIYDLTLKQVEADFEKWRKTKLHHNIRIPEYLWQKVIPLLKHYKISKITSTLKLSGEQINQKLKQLKLPAIKNKSIKSSANKTIKFLELTGKPTLIDSNAVTKIEISSANGSKLCMDAVPIAHVQQIINCFLSNRN